MTWTNKNRKQEGNNFEGRKNNMGYLWSKEARLNTGKLTRFIKGFLYVSENVHNKKY